MNCSLLYVTTGSVEEAKSIARVLVEERVVACANILPGMTSLFYWEGEAQEDNEVVLILKTRSALAEAVKERVLALHSYTCPCVVALPIAGGNAGFLEWISAETEAGARKAGL